MTQVRSDSRARTTRLLLTAIVALHGLVLSACGDDEAKRTQLVVAVDSDLRVPDELDEVHVLAKSLRSGARPAQSAEGRLGDGGLTLPVSVTLEPGSDRQGAIEVTARGYRDGTLVVEQTREVSFVRDASKVLKMTLARACAAAVAPSCEDDETCLQGDCVARLVPPRELLDYAGPDELGSYDAGADGGDADAATGDGGDGDGDGGDADAATGDGGADAGFAGCVAEDEDEQCNGRDDDCDRRIDEGFNLSSVARCGRCDRACPAKPAFAASACVDGECVLVCAPGMADCDDAIDGCETPVNTPMNCGGCGVKCEGSTPLCATSGAMASCTGACGGDAPIECDDACVDTQTDTFYCGDCETTCAGEENATAVCNGGNCELACLGDFDDCDDVASNGCEVDTSSDPEHCGACAAACPARDNMARSCVDGECHYVCNAGFADCNALPGDGCEINVVGNTSHCGACNNACGGLQGCCGAPSRCSALSLCL